MTTTFARPTPVSRLDVVDAVTRREFIAMLGAAGLLAACGDDDGGAPAQESATRTIEHFSGTTEVPVSPQRIVTLQDQNALLPLLELGVRPVASLGGFNDVGEGVFRRTDGFDTSGIEFLGDFLEPNLEAIAAVRPDLIIGNEFKAADLFEELSAIAPTVIIQVFDRPLTEALRDFARVVGREAEAQDFLAAYDERIDGFLAELGEDVDDLSVALISAGDPGAFFVAGIGGQAQSTVMDDLGLRRPPAQANEDEISLEQLTDHDADAFIIVDFSGEEPDPGVGAIVESPIFDNLAATRAGQSFTIDGGVTVGSAWARMDDFLDELRRILLAPDFDVTVVEE